MTKWNMYLKALSRKIVSLITAALLAMRDWRHCVGGSTLFVRSSWQLRQVDWKFSNSVGLKSGTGWCQSGWCRSAAWSTCNSNKSSKIHIRNHESVDAWLAVDCTLVTCQTYPYGVLGSLCKGCQSFTVLHSAAVPLLTLKSSNCIHWYRMCLCVMQQCFAASKGLMCWGVSAAHGKLGLSWISLNLNPINSTGKFILFHFILFV